MAKISPNRRIELAGVHAVRALLDDHDHLVQEISGSNDHGEDLHVLLTRNRRRTGYVLAIQVKSGRKYKRSKGYSIPIEDHYEDWKNSKIPVVGIVHDLETKNLYWVNITAVLQNSEERIKRVDIPRTSLLNSETMSDFTSAIESYVDSTGARLREFTLEEAWAAISRALDGLDPNNVPNPLFEPLAELLFRHERRTKQIARVALQLCPLLLLSLLLVYEWPYQVRYVNNYTELNPVLVVGSLYILISWMTLTIFFELRAGRRPKETGNRLIAVCALYLWIPVTDDGDGVEWLSESLVVSSVLVSHFGLLTLMALYIKREVKRKKRRSA
ncbi:DUF4365 domain-containing protein [Streptomyces rubiginosohelvolus]|uniref:DUF4365 domain-containing protein n=1 Tax=Streptomyces rubiginosohelvolus TaxID=67362 RepID=UPI00365052CE